LVPQFQESEQPPLSHPLGKKKLHLSKFEIHLGTAPSRLQEFQSTCSCQLNNRAANPLVLSFELTPTGDSVRLRIRHGIVRISGNIPEEKQRKAY
jgi:hypothetical protein